MAKTYDFVWYFGEGSGVIETEKAYGLQYHDNRHWSSAHGNKTMWLPKSQITVEELAEPVREDYDSEYEYMQDRMCWQEGLRLVSVPMWLAREKDYFKGMLE